MARQSKKTAAKGDVALKIALEGSEDTPVFYVNYAEASLGEHDIQVAFARINIKPPRNQVELAKETGTLSVEPTLQLILAPTLLPQLIRVLQSMQEQLEQRAAAGKGDSK